MARLREVAPCARHMQRGQPCSRGIDDASCDEMIG
jgi:hypothetical protein